MEKEIWRSVSGYEGLYEVSSYGRVRSLDRVAENNNKLKGRLLSPRKHSGGYVRVSLCKRGNVLDFFIHRLVAKTFIANPREGNQVNHINGNKTDNRVSNLEWVNDQQNKAHAWGIGLHKKTLQAFKKSHKTKARPILCVEKGFIYSSASEAARALGLKRGNIHMVAKGKRKTSGGLTWEYVRPPENY